ncbi:MAG: hypothetical protein V1824_00095 [archaeon]
MIHITIMSKNLKLIEKILTREKTIESRWYKSKKAPYDKLKIGETIYFKNNNGEAVSAKATVQKIMQFDNLTSKKVKELLDTYSEKIQIQNKEQAYMQLKDKRYCILVFLKNPIALKPKEQFQINKTGFGNQCAWISAENINQIKI